jgi:hypothetical protein
VIAAVAPESETARELSDAGAGLVVPAGKPEGLLDALVQVTSDPTFARELGERGRAFQEANLIKAAALATLDQFLVGVLDTRGCAMRPQLDGAPG